MACTPRTLHEHATHASMYAHTNTQIASKFPWQQKLKWWILRCIYSILQSICVGCLTLFCADLKCQPDPFVHSCTVTYVTCRRALARSKFTETDLHMWRRRNVSHNPNSSIVLKKAFGNLAPFECISKPIQYNMNIIIQSIIQYIYSF